MSSKTAAEGAEARTAGAAAQGGGASRLTAKGLVLLVAIIGALVTGDVTVGAEITGKLGLGARATIGFADFTRSERFAG